MSLPCEATEPEGPEAMLLMLALRCTPGAGASAEAWAASPALRAAEGASSLLPSRRSAAAADSMLPPTAAPSADPAVPAAAMAAARAALMRGATPPPLPQACREGPSLRLKKKDTSPPRLPAPSDWGLSAGLSPEADDVAGLVG